MVSPELVIQPNGTPRPIFDALDMFYHFSLDPCADNGDSALCQSYFTPKENGLKQSWGFHRVFCNPPDGDPAMWVAKAIYETELKTCPVVIMLLPRHGDWEPMVDLHARDTWDIPINRMCCFDKNGSPLPMYIVRFQVLDTIP